MHLVQNNKIQNDIQNNIQYNIQNNKTLLQHTKHVPERTQ